MTKKTRMRLKYVNKVLYLLSIAMLISGAILSFITTPVAADSGRIWTTTGCGSAAQKANHYAVGDHVFINFEDMPAGTHTWEIRYTNKAGKPLVSLASNPLIQGTGTVSGAAGCFEAWVVQPEETGYQFKVYVDDKHHVYGVDEPTPIPENTAASTPTFTATATVTSTATSPFTATPTYTAMLSTTEISTPNFNATPTLTATSQATNTSTFTATPTLTAAPADTNTPEPTTTTAATNTPEPTTTLAPTNTPDPIAALADTNTTEPIPENPPTQQPTDQFLTDPAAPTPEVIPSATTVPTLYMPAAVENKVLNPITGADLGGSAPFGASSKLMMGGLALLGAALIVTGIRRRYGLQKA